MHSDPEQRVAPSRCGARAKLSGTNRNAESVRLRADQHRFQESPGASRAFELEWAAPEAPQPIRPGPGEDRYDERVSQSYFFNKPCPSIHDANSSIQWSDGKFSCNSSVPLSEPCQLLSGQTKRAGRIAGCRLSCACLTEPLSPSQATSHPGR